MNKKLLKKIMLETDSWSTRHLSQGTSEPAYYIVGWQILSFSRERKSEVNLKHKIQTYVIHKISQGHITFFEEVGIDSRKHAQDSLKTQNQRNK